MKTTDGVIHANPKSIDEHCVNLLEGYEREFKQGNNSALLPAIDLCLSGDIPTPEWVAHAFRIGLINWESGEERTLGDAFRIRRPKNWSQKRARKDAVTNVIWQSVVARLNVATTGGRRERIARDLFEAVAEELNASNRFPGLSFNGTDISEAYYAVEGVTKKRKNSR